MPNATAVAIASVHPALKDVAPTTVIIACPDPRYQGSLRHFIYNELGLQDGEYVLLQRLGGAVAFSDPAATPGDLKNLKSEVRLCLRHFRTITRVIPINHEGCVRYREIQNALGNGFLRGYPDIAMLQKADLRFAAGHIGEIAHEIAPRGITVDPRFMRCINDGDDESVTVSFDKME